MRAMPLSHVTSHLARARFLCGAISAAQSTLDERTLFSLVESKRAMTSTVLTQSVATPQTGTMFRDNRVYLECPYHEKDIVKQFGARWDNTQRRWYAPPGTNLEPLIPWMTDRLYLHCTAEDQGLVESLGAHYDTTICNYYILDNCTDREPFARWLP
jgi:hypothetical protein